MVSAYLTNASEFCVRSVPKTEIVNAEVDAESCPFSIPTISRSDPNFFDNSYWRGRTWGPTNLLTWMSLSQEPYSNIPSVAAARKGLCQQSFDLMMKEWLEKRHVHENYNSTTGVGGDVPNSNPFYHWGANLVYIGMREAMKEKQTPHYQSLG